MKPAIYLAAPLFSVAEKDFNLRLADALEPYFRVYLPQRDGGLIGQLIQSGLDVVDAKRKVFDSDLAAIKSSEYLLIVLDGRAIDEGAAVELGYAYALGKRCFALQTDIRRAAHGKQPYDRGLYRADLCHV